MYSTQIAIVRYLKKLNRLDVPIGRHKRLKVRVLFDWIESKAVILVTLR